MSHDPHTLCVLVELLETIGEEEPAHLWWCSSGITGHRTEIIELAERLYVLEEAASSVDAAYDWLLDKFGGWDGGYLEAVIRQAFAHVPEGQKDNDITPDWDRATQWHTVQMCRAMERTVPLYESEKDSFDIAKTQRKGTV